MAVRNVGNIDEGAESGIFAVRERPLLMRTGPRSHRRPNAQVLVQEWA